MKKSTHILALSILFGLIETAHFGWHALPSSAAEMVCDGITTLLFAMSLGLRAFGK